MNPHAQESRIYARNCLSSAGTISALRSGVDVSAAKSVAPSEDCVFRDGLGDRFLVRDAHGRPAHECLLIRPELFSVPTFEFALNERLWVLEKFDHPAFLTIRMTRFRRLLRQSRLRFHRRHSAV